MDSRGTVQRAVKLAQDDLKAQDQESLCIGGREGEKEGGREGGSGGEEDLVVLTGLKKASHYNGQYAIVSGQAKGERLPVRLIENREKTLAARPSNLLKATSIKSAEARDTSKVQAVLAKRLPPPFRSDFLYVPPPLTKVRAPRGAEGGVASGNGSSSSRGAQIILSNILILLPGLGDTAAPYRKFAASMELPQTGCVSLRPPLPIPLDMGYQWFESFEPDMNLIQPKKGEKRRIRSLQKSRSILHDAIGAIRATFNLPLSRIFLFGFSQGGIVCVDTALNPPLGTYYDDNTLNVQRGLSGRIGGVIAVSSSLLEEFEEAAEGEEEEEEGKRGEGRGANDSNGEAKKQIEHIRRSTPFLITHGTLDRRWW
eukprot:jgi/Bigna1/71301/fgenesh1_pg.15_\